MSKSGVTSAGLIPTANGDVAMQNGPGWGSTISTSTGIQPAPETFVAPKVFAKNDPHYEQPAATGATTEGNSKSGVIPNSSIKGETVKKMQEFDKNAKAEAAAKRDAQAEAAKKQREAEAAQRKDNGLSAEQKNAMTATLARMNNGEIPNDPGMRESLARGLGIDVGSTTNYR